MLSPPPPHFSPSHPLPFCTPTASFPLCLSSSSPPLPPLCLYQSVHILHYSTVSAFSTCLILFPLPLSFCLAGVRAWDDISILQVHPHHNGKSTQIVPLPLFCPLFLHFSSFLSPAFPPLSVPLWASKGVNRKKVLNRWKYREVREKKREAKKKEEGDIWKTNYCMKMWMCRGGWWEEKRK